MGLRRFLRKRGWELLARVEDPQLRTLNYLKKIKSGQFTGDAGELEFFNFCLEYYSKSTGENFQDLFAFWMLKQKKNGVYIEFGATDGVFGSNSLMLEREGWRGILSEPAKCWHQRLKQNRPNATIDFRCVWKETGNQLEFSECEAEGLSTIKEFSNLDHHADVREKSVHYMVTTVTLNDLLDQHGLSGADYLSIDTEGSEFEILRAWDPAKHPISIITVEHNYVEKNRNAIEKLMCSRGYVPMLRKFSQFDDWYVHSSLCKLGFV